MVDDGLLNYVKQQLAKGYSAKEVENFLLTRGYQPRQLQPVFRQIFAQSSRPQIHKHRHHPLALISVFVVILILISSLVLYVMFPSEEIAEVSFSIQLPQTEFSPTEAVAFTGVAENKGGSSSFPVTVLYEVKDGDGNLVTTVSDKFTLISTLEKQVSLGINHWKPGAYSVVAIVNADGKEQRESTSFIVKDVSTTKASCFDGILNQAETGVDCGGPCKKCVRQCPVFIDDGNSCTNDFCGPETNYLPVHEDVVPCCGNDICEEKEQSTCVEDCQGSSSYFSPSVESVGNDIPLKEQLESIKSMAVNEPNRAAELCDAIVLSFSRDQCFDTIAESTKNPQFCAQITEERSRDKCYTMASKLLNDFSWCSSIASDLRRDSCYMRFALAGDFSVCDSIVDNYYVQSCKQLKELSVQAPDSLNEFAGNVV